MLYFSSRTNVNKCINASAVSGTFSCQCLKIKKQDCLSSAALLHWHEIMTQRKVHYKRNTDNFYTALVDQSAKQPKDMLRFANQARGSLFFSDKTPASASAFIVTFLLFPPTQTKQKKQNKKKTTAENQQVHSCCLGFVVILGKKQEIKNQSRRQVTSRESLMPQKVCKS